MGRLTNKVAIVTGAAIGRAAELTLQLGQPFTHHRLRETQTPGCL